MTYEMPNDLKEFSLGTASGLTATGTTWRAIQDGSNVFLLRPGQDNEVWQFFYGISPSYAWIYRSYPNGFIRGGLTASPTVGGDTGYTTGRESPYNEPSSVSEFFTTEGISPAFIGYHPFVSPSSITIRMNFFGVRYKVEYVANATPKRIIPVGGIPPIASPTWLNRKLGA